MKHLQHVAYISVYASMNRISLRFVGLTLSMPNNLTPANLYNA